MKNRTKDKFVVTVIAITLMWILVLLMVGISKLFADSKVIELTEQGQINRFYSEEKIKAEMYYLAGWQIIEDMSDTEYADTFLRS